MLPLFLIAFCNGIAIRSEQTTLPDFFPTRWKVRKAIRARRQQLLAAFLMGFIFAVFAGTRAARAEGAEAALVTAGAGTVGYDISWPQCGEPNPQGEIGFAVIGLTGGKPFTRNRCFDAQYQWARQAEAHPDVYINLDYPKTTDWNTFVGPAGICMGGQAACVAYNWGYNSARDAVALARAKGITPTVWWLDVEQENYWSPEKGANERVVSGAIDYLKAQGLNIGVYSTSYQWGEITGGYRPNVRAWVAGARNLAEAEKKCGQASFTGGPVAMVQWVEKFDRNLICAAGR